MQILDELLLTSEAQRKELFERAESSHPLIGGEDPKEVEFLGNGPQYMGRCYGRAAIVFWPRANRKLVQAQSPAGAAAIAKEAARAVGGGGGGGR